MNTWTEYRSHKIVRAAPIVGIGPKTSDDTATVLFVGDPRKPFTPNVPAMADKASIGDYAVVYADGYKSVSPKAAFEDGYTPV